MPMFSSKSVPSPRVLAVNGQPVVVEFIDNSWEATLPTREGDVFTRSPRFDDIVADVDWANEEFTLH